MVNFSFLFLSASINLDLKMEADEKRGMVEFLKEQNTQNRHHISKGPVVPISKDWKEPAVWPARDSLVELPDN